MIKARIRWCSCRVENILTLGRLLRLWFCFLLHSILFFISQTSYRTYKIISSYELARPIMGTIFLVIIIVYLFTSSDKPIHRDLELLTSTSYTSGFDPQGVPAEKPRNLLTTHHHRSVGLLGLLLQCENIYLGPQMVHWTFAFTHTHHGKIIF